MTDISMVAMETHITMIFYPKWSQVGKDNFWILAFKTEWEYNF